MWGPTDVELLAARVAAVRASVAQQDEPEFDDNSNDDMEDDEDNWSDEGLVEAIETLDLTDGHREYSFEHDNLE